MMSGCPLNDDRATVAPLGSCSEKSRRADSAFGSGFRWHEGVGLLQDAPAARSATATATPARRLLRLGRITTNLLHSKTSDRVSSAGHARAPIVAINRARLAGTVFAQPRV